MPAGLSKGDENPLKKDTGIRKVMSLASTPRDSKKAAENVAKFTKIKKPGENSLLDVCVDCV